MVFVGTPESCRILHCGEVDYIITSAFGDVFFVNIELEQLLPLWGKVALKMMKLVSV